MSKHPTPLDVSAAENRIHEMLILGHDDTAIRKEVIETWGVDFNTAKKWVKRRQDLVIEKAKAVKSDDESAYDLYLAFERLNFLFSKAILTGDLALALKVEIQIEKLKGLDKKESKPSGRQGPQVAIQINNGIEAAEGVDEDDLREIAGTTVPKVIETEPEKPTIPAVISTEFADMLEDESKKK